MLHSKFRSGRWWCSRSLSLFSLHQPLSLQSSSRFLSFLSSSSYQSTSWRGGGSFSSVTQTMSRARTTTRRFLLSLGSFTTLCGVGMTLNSDLLGRQERTVRGEEGRGPTPHSSSAGLSAEAATSTPGSNQNKGVTGTIHTKKWHYYTGKAPKEATQNMLLLSGNANQLLAQEVSEFLGVPLSPTEISLFEDGEIKIRVQENVRGQDVYVIQPVVGNGRRSLNDSLMELLLLVSTLRRASASHITAVIPYFGYARQDRKMASRVPISAADVAVLLTTMGVDRVVAVDLHSGQIQGFFPPHVPVDNLESMCVSAHVYAEMSLWRPVVVSSDGKSVYRAKSFLEILHQEGHPDARLAMLLKEKDQAQGPSERDGAEDEREDEEDHDVNDEPDQISAFGVDETVFKLVGDVDDSDCIIVQDILDTGTTLCQRAQELRRRGARRVFAFATHGLFSSNAIEIIGNCKDLDKVMVTNTTPACTRESCGNKVSRLTIAPLLAETIKRIHMRDSVSDVFANHEAPPTSKPKPSS